MISNKQFYKLEQIADDLFSQYGLDVRFTRHFKERINDKRNPTQPTFEELVSFFKTLEREYGRHIGRQNVGYDAIAKEISRKLNMAMTVAFDDREGDIDLIIKTAIVGKLYGRSSRNQDMLKFKNESFRSEMDDLREPFIYEFVHAIVSAMWILQENIQMEHSWEDEIESLADSGVGIEELRAAIIKNKNNGAFRLAEAVYLCAFDVLSDKLKMEIISSYSSYDSGGGVLVDIAMAYLNVGVRISKQDVVDMVKSPFNGSYKMDLDMKEIEEIAMALNQVKVEGFTLEQDLSFDVDFTARF